jgi:DNA polymerase
MEAKPQKLTRRGAAQWFESLAAAGVSHVGRSGKRPASKKAVGASTDDPGSAAAGNVGPRGDSSLKQRPAVANAPPAGARAGHTPAAAASSGVKPSATAGMPVLAPDGGDPWETLRCEVAACVRCSELARTRTQTVFGVGNRQARLCFLGEAPGADEDRQGEPFVGAAGQLLNKIIEACRMSRSDVYILNVLKCRPPGNRAPVPDEAANCREYLDRQLALIKPEFICCLGAVAAQNLLGTTTPIGRLRGQLHTLGDVQVLCTYHPAYLLRNPAAKRDVWEDMKRLMAAIGTPVD